SALQFEGDFLRVLVQRETYGCADRNVNMPGTSGTAFGLPQLKQSVYAHRYYGQIQLCCEQADAGLERQQVAVRCSYSLWKYQNAPAPIGKIARKRKTPAEAGFSRKRKYVEKRDDKKIVQAFNDTLPDTHFFWRVAHRREPLAIHSRRKTITKPR